MPLRRQGVSIKDIQKQIDIYTSSIRTMGGVSKIVARSTHSLLLGQLSIARDIADLRREVQELKDLST